MSAWLRVGSTRCWSDEADANGEAVAVMPANAGILDGTDGTWIPAFAGMTCLLLSMRLTQLSI